MRFIAILWLAGIGAYSSVASAVVVSSNNFTAFAAAVEGASPGTTFTFNLGANSTIFFDRAITVPNNITFSGNNAVTFDGGGSVSLFAIPTTTTATFSGFTFQNASASSGGAIASSGQLNVDNSSFFHNQAINSGGAILGNMRVTNSVFAFNDAGNTGGAVSCGGGSFNMFVENSTFYANHAGNTGGAVRGGTLSEILRNVTIFGNSAGVGGGVDNDSRGVMLIESSLIAGNSGGSPDLNADSTATVRSSLIGIPNGNNLVNGVNGNLIGNGSTVSGFPIANLLGPLQNNGGPIQTMALLDSGALTNPALNVGSNPDNMLFDQRGAPFARQFGSGVDIGAFERQAVPEGSTLITALFGLATIWAGLYRKANPREAYFRFSSGT
jgi:hypothetical protein